MSVSRRLSAVLLLAACLCVRVAPQASAPIGIRPQPPDGKGVVFLKAALLIDGTGAAPGLFGQGRGDPCVAGLVSECGIIAFDPVGT